MNSVLRKLSSIYDQLPKSQKRVADFILNHSSRVTTLTIQDLASLCETSTTTVVRLCRELDVDSFTTLKIEIAKMPVTKEMIENTDIKADETFQSIKEKLLVDAYRNMQDTIDQMKCDQVDDVITLLYEADLVYVYAIGASRLTAENVVHKWNRVGKTIICLSDPHLIAGTVSVKPDKKIVLLSISNRGETKEVIRLQRIVKQLGVTTVALTQFGRNTLAHEADYTIQTAKSIENEMRSAATSSLHAQFIYVDVLFYAYLTKYFNEVTAKIHQSRLAVEKLKKGE